MRALALAVALLLTGPALAATIVTDIDHPAHIGKYTVKRTGPTKLVAVRVERGTCFEGEFGVWEGVQAASMPIDRMRFPEVPYRRTCMRAYWKMKNGVWSGPSIVDIVRLLP